MATALRADKKALAAVKIDNNIEEKFYVITAEWNSHITHKLRDSAVDSLLIGGVSEENIEILSVPGAIELVNAAALIMNNGAAAIIVIGCVIRGDTPHFDYVCQSVTQGVTLLNSQGDAPVIFGVLTVENEEQALERAGGKLGNKGAEFAETAITMANLHNGSF